MKLKWIAIVLIIFFIFTSCEIEYGNQYEYGGYLYVYHADYSDGVFFDGIGSNYSTSTLYIPEYIYGQKVIGISDRALMGSNFSEVVFSDEIIFVDNGAFQMSSNLQKVHFNDKLSEIGAYAFYNCDNLNEIILPASVKTIGDNAFGQNVQWGDISVYIYAEVPPEGNGNIPQRNELKIYVPEESVELYKKHRSWVTYRDYIFPME